MNTLDIGALPGRSIEVCIGHVAVGQVLLWVLWFSLVSIIPPVLHTMLLPERQTGEVWNLPSSSALLEIGDRRINKYFQIYLDLYVCL